MRLVWLSIVLSFFVVIVLSLMVILLLRDKKHRNYCRLYDESDKEILLTSFSYIFQKSDILANIPLERNAHRGKIGLVMPIFGRPQIVKQCIDSLSKSKLDEVICVFVDETRTKLDKNTSDDVEKVLKGFTGPSIKIFKKKHGNMFDSLKMGLDLLYLMGVETFVILDSDTVVKPDWLKSLKDIFLLPKTQPSIVTGFHTINHPTKKVERNFRVKKTIGGINMMFDLSTYRTCVRPALFDKGWDWNVCDCINDKKGTIVATRPSVVDHIGKNGLNSSHRSYDKADDFF